MFTAICTGAYKHLLKEGDINGVVKFYSDYGPEIHNLADSFLLDDLIKNKKLQSIHFLINQKEVDDQFIKNNNSQIIYSTLNAMMDHSPSAEEYEIMESYLDDSRLIPESGFKNFIENSGEEVVAFVERCPDSLQRKLRKFLIEQFKTGQ